MNTNTIKPAFFQINDAIYATDLRAPLKFTLVVLSGYINTERDWRVWPTQETLCELTGYGERSIRRYTDELEQLGFFSRVELPCHKGKRYEYTLNPDRLGLPANLSKSGEGAANQSEGAANQSTQPDSLADKEIIEEPKKNQQEVFQTHDVRSAHLCEGKTEKTPLSGIKGESLVENFKTKCKKYNNARVRFYMDCGRLHSEADHFHNPKKPKLPMTFPQRDKLRYWFDMLPESGCAVMNFAMASWPQLREQWNKTHDTKWSRLPVAPTIDGLLKVGSNWKEGPEFLYPLWRQSLTDEMLERAAVHATIEDELTFAYGPSAKQA